MKTLQDMIAELLPEPPPGWELYAINSNADPNWYICWAGEEGEIVGITVKPNDQSPSRVADMFWKAVANMQDEYESRARKLQAWMLKTENVQQLLAAKAGQN